MQNRISSFVLALICMMTLLGQCRTWAASTEKISNSSLGVQGNGASIAASASADGKYVAFESLAQNFAGVTSFRQVYLRNRNTPGTTTLVSANVSSNPGNGNSADASISGDGRFVAFVSNATDLVAGGGSANGCVYVRDMWSGGIAISLVSVNNSGQQANGSSGSAFISADGRFVVFQSTATNLVAGVNNGVQQIYLRDLVNGTTELVSQSSGAAGNNVSSSPYVSGDGRYVAFVSSSTNFGSITNGKNQIFVRDRVQGITQIVSVSAGSVVGDGDSSTPAISTNGSIVAYVSQSTNLIAGTAGSKVYAYNMQNGSVELISTGVGIAAADTCSTNGIGISPDGLYVFFDSKSGTHTVNVFVRNRTLGSTTILSPDYNIGVGNGDSYHPSSSVDARRVAFDSLATDLAQTPADTNGVADVFLRSNWTVQNQGTAGSPAITFLSPTGTYATENTTVDVEGIAVDPLATASITQVTWANQTLSGAPGSTGTCTGTGYWSALGIPLKYGANTIKIEATDDGAYKGSSLLTVNLSDHTLPNVSITAPSANPYSTTANTINIAGTASDNVSVASVAWQNDRGGSGACTGTASWTYNGVPVLAGVNVITVTATDEAGNTKSTTLTVNVAPTISSFTPTTGGVGAAVTITGANLTGATKVEFNGTSATFTVVSATSITTTVPAGVATGKIKVTTPGGNATSAADFTFIPAPTISSFTPTIGGVGAVVTITGAHFTGATSVKFNNTSASITSVTDTSITTAVPAGASTGKIKVTTPGGEATSTGDFTFVGTPTITSFTPTAEIVGASVVITGTHLADATSVKFNGASAVITANSDTSITVTVPDGATTGHITVETIGGTATSTDEFALVTAPTISSFTPSLGGVGTCVTITGTQLANATSVKFNGTSAVITANTGTSITAMVPSGTTTGCITVTTKGGTETSADQFTFVPLPTMSSVKPWTGYPGTSVTITGKNFANATSMKFNGTPAVITNNTDTSITATVSAGSTTGRIAITTLGGTATTNYDFVVPGPPTISSVAPWKGFVGASVVITGRNLTAATVKFNGTAATISAQTGTSITATVPVGATTGKITVTTPAGTATTTYDFVVPTPPTFSSVAPWKGFVGTTVVITGHQFTGTTAVKFNGTTATVTALSDTSITTTVPAGATTGKITVTTPAGTATTTYDFVVPTPPTFSSVSPWTGFVGTTVVITGHQFTGTTAVKFNGTTAVVTALSDTSITTTVPAGATTGKITVTTPAGTATTTYDFVVPAPPTFSSIAPWTGFVGTSVVITGHNFTGTTAVKFNGTTANVTALSDTSITTEVPAGATTGKITVTTPAGTATTTYEFVVLP